MKRRNFLALGVAAPVASVLPALPVVAKPLGFHKDSFSLVQPLPKRFGEMTQIERERMKNYWTSITTEKIALSPKQPFIYKP